MKGPLIRQGILAREDGSAGEGATAGSGKENGFPSVRAEAASGDQGHGAGRNTQSTSNNITNPGRSAQQYTATSGQNMSAKFQPSGTNDSIMDRAMLHSSSNIVRAGQPLPANYTPAAGPPGITTSGPGRMTRKAAESTLSTANATAAAQALINLNTVTDSAAGTGDSTVTGFGTTTLQNDVPGDNSEELSYLDISRVSNNISSSNGGYSQYQQHARLSAGFMDPGTTGFGSGLAAEGSGRDGPGSSGDADLLAGGNGPPLTNEYFTGLEWPTCDGVYFFSEGRLFDI
ncbi:uncharacterized protein B0I36DRAFT_324733 [Microdochium trichocladiopsis]|uniref:Uncharacterized protein n=1 Tax=Microdochium trichocladiopsis TaxID=1682393 RepID=A0A9P8Y381_9PEZI|nr:uncharacterized protein B0I36DRAFT_324733 [Microdochium trichocladiopsis]KAH7028908.1 hypothetical protein B0I36DRAFT_324733 [Microdochium trichocladiopsis]